MKKKILALETSTNSCSAAIYTEKKIYARHQVAPQEHSKFILGMVDELLEESELTLPEFDALAIGIGPGSFTGLRLSASIAQGLAYGSSNKIIPISTLQALAQAAWRRFKAKNVISVLDARMQEAYIGAYRISKAGFMETDEISDQIWQPDAPLDLNELMQNQSWLAVGTGIIPYEQQLAEQFSIIKIEHALAYPSAIDVAILGAHAHATPDSGVCPKEISPVYIRNNVAN